MTTCRVFSYFSFFDPELIFEVIINFQPPFSPLPPRHHSQARLVLLPSEFLHWTSPLPVAQDRPQVHLASLLVDPLIELGLLLVRLMALDSSERLGECR